MRYIARRAEGWLGPPRGGGAKSAGPARTTALAVRRAPFWRRSCRSSSSTTRRGEKSKTSAGLGTLLRVEVGMRGLLLHDANAVGEEHVGNAEPVGVFVDHGREPSVAELLQLARALVNRRGLASRQRCARGPFARRADRLRPSGSRRRAPTSGDRVGRRPRSRRRPLRGGGATGSRGPRAPPCADGSAASASRRRSVAATPCGWRGE